MDLHFKPDGTIFGYKTAEVQSYLNEIGSVPPSDDVVHERSLNGGKQKFYLTKDIDGHICQLCTKQVHLFVEFDFHFPYRICEECIAELAKGLSLLKDGLI